MAAAIGLLNGCWSVKHVATRCAKYFFEPRFLKIEEGEVAYQDHMKGRVQFSKSREVPSQICAIWGQKQPFFAQNGPSKGSKQPNEGKRMLHCTCGLPFP